MFDTKPFVEKAASESGRAVTAECEARLLADETLGKSGLLCAVEDGLVFVEEQLLDPGPVTLLDAEQIRQVRMEKEFLEANLVVETEGESLTFAGVEQEDAERLVKAAGLGFGPAADHEAETDAQPASPDAEPVDLQGELELEESSQLPAQPAPPAAPKPARPTAPKAPEPSPPQAAGKSVVLLMFLAITSVVVYFLIAPRDAPPPPPQAVQRAPEPVPELETKAAPAMLTLKSPQSNVRVLVNGKVSGTLPVVVRNVPPGKVNLRFVGDPWQHVVERTVELRPGQHLVLSDIRLPKLRSADVDAASSSEDGTAKPAEDEAMLGSLNLNSLPPSDVIVDGAPRGRTPIAGLKVQPGTHAVIFRHPELGTQARSVSVKAGETRAVVVRFARP